MKASISRVLVLPALFLVSMSPLLAHPGHDDGHELTWELGHLAAHPLATAACLLLIAAAGWATFVLVRRAPALRAQSFRGSQPSRGK
jgi:hydrogenase/urease accessory protein HupE